MWPDRLARSTAGTCGHHSDRGAFAALPSPGGEDVHGLNTDGTPGACTPALDPATGTPEGRASGVSDPGLRIGFGGVTAEPMGAGAVSPGVPTAAGTRSGGIGWVGLAASLWDPDSESRAMSTSGSSDVRFARRSSMAAARLLLLMRRAFSASS